MIIIKHEPIKAFKYDIRIPKRTRPDLAILFKLNSDTSATTSMSNMQPQKEMTILSLMVISFSKVLKKMMSRKFDV
ncbi:unnamed protein product [Ambrosiozyma monospora]|uniref:Unnamed protein product n=1 Tax=Ambrosiozyma monospora TaxID=43982 RepID=A0A9W6YSV8_AMBMO|nr:unnamed protein product [Ambrosiozyma monospora]